MASSTLPADLLVEGLNALFMQRMMGNDTDFLSIVANMVSTSKKTETFAFIGDVPAFREWLARRQITALSNATYSITVRDWENSITIDMRDMDDEQIPMLATRITQLADQARRHSVQLMVDTIVSGQTGLGYDGVSFFNDAHPIRGDQTATQDNDLALTTGGATVAEDLQTDYDAGHVAMSRFVDEAGQPFHGDVAPQFLILAPPERFRDWSTVLFSTTQPTNDGQNVYRGQGDLITTSRLTDTGDYYMMKTDGAVKPFIMLERQPIRTTNSLTPSETWRPTKEVIYGADVRYAAGYGMWQYAVSFT